MNNAENARLQRGLDKEVARSGERSRGDLMVVWACVAAAVLCFAAAVIGVAQSSGH